MRRTVNFRALAHTSCARRSSKDPQVYLWLTKVPRAVTYYLGKICSGKKEDLIRVKVDKNEKSSKRCRNYSV
jgi:hypothetical protein